MKNILLGFSAIGMVVFMGLGFTARSHPVKIGDEIYGGVIAFVDSTGEHGIVCSLQSLGKLKWEKAKKKCSEYSYLGFDDWHLPSKYELNILYENLHKKGIGGFFNTIYWSSTDYGTNLAWRQFFANGAQGNSTHRYKYSVIPVRAF